MKKIKKIILASLISLSVIFMGVSCGGNKDVTGNDNGNTTGTDTEDKGTPVDDYEGLTGEEILKKFLSVGSYDMVSKTSFDMKYNGLDFSQLTIINGTLEVKSTEDSGKVIQTLLTEYYGVTAKDDDGFELLKTMFESEELVNTFPEDEVIPDTLKWDEAEKAYTVEVISDPDDSVFEGTYSEFMEEFSGNEKATVVINNEKTVLTISADYNTVTHMVVTITRQN